MCIRDRLSAYQTLYTCLETVAKLMAPIAPFYADQLFLDLVAVTGRENVESVHLSDFPVYDESKIDKNLEERMQMAQDVSSMVLAPVSYTHLDVYKRQGYMGPFFTEFNLNGQLLPVQYPATYAHEMAHSLSTVSYTHLDEGGQWFVGADLY